MNERKRLLIATRDGVVRGWFEEFFLRYNDLEGDVLPESRDAAERISATKPHAVLLDIPSTGSFDATIFEKIRAADPYLPIITLTEAGTRKRGCSPGPRGLFEHREAPGRRRERSTASSSTPSRTMGRGEVSPGHVGDEGEVRSRQAQPAGAGAGEGLQHMIGETEEPASIFKHSFSLIKSYLPFEAFAALVPGRRKRRFTSTRMWRSMRTSERS